MNRVAVAGPSSPPAAAEAAASLAPRPRRGRPPKSRADSGEGNRRRQVIEGAARLFRAKGFAGTSTRDIAAAAGMRSGSPFYHFQSKNALLYVVMQEGMAQALQSQTQALAALPSEAAPRERLRTLVRHHFEILLGPHSDFIPVMLYEWRSLTPEQRTDIAQLKDHYEAAWAPVLQALHVGGALKADPTAARLFVLGALNWSGQWFSPLGALSLDELTEQLLTLFLGMVEGQSISALKGDSTLVAIAETVSAAMSPDGVSAALAIRSASHR